MLLPRAAGGGGWWSPGEGAPEGAGGERRWWVLCWLRAGSDTAAPSRAPVLSSSAFLPAGACCCLPARRGVAGSPSCPGEHEPRRRAAFPRHPPSAIPARYCAFCSPAGSIQRSEVGENANPEGFLPVVSPCAPSPAPSRPHVAGRRLSGQRGAVSAPSSCRPWPLPGSLWE